MNKTNKCPNCGKPKKPWFEVCWECTKEENKKPKCDICYEEVPEGHNLCKKHWLEQQQDKKEIRQVKYVVQKKKDELEQVEKLHQKKEKHWRDKYLAKFRFDAIKVRSKSELLICHFLTTNNISFRYEPLLNIDGKKHRPDFILKDKKNNCVILEHFGMDTPEYIKDKEIKKKLYKKFCNEKEDYDFIFTSEEDILDLKENLGEKLEKTIFKKGDWI